jgi:hypothetical protein
MKETIKKIDAAQRQLDTAIELWFREQDPISVHTLACSAYQIIHDITQHRNGHELLFDTVVVKDEYRREFKSFIKSSYNFFKHADKDPDPEGTIEFPHQITDLFILYSVLGLKWLNIRYTITCKAFMLYYSIMNPFRLTEEGLKFIQENIPSEKLADIRKLKRNEFFQGVQLFFGK